MKIVRVLVIGVSSILVFAAWLATLGLHLATAYIPFHNGNFFGTVLTFVFPLASEVYWFARLWWQESFWNGYTLMVLGWAALALSAAGLMVLAVRMQAKADEASAAPQNIGDNLRAIRGSNENPFASADDAWRDYPNFSWKEGHAPGERGQRLVLRADEPATPAAGNTSPNA